MKLRKRTIALILVVVIASLLFITTVVSALKGPKWKFPNSDFDSGWVNANTGMEDITFTHNLGTRDLFVYIYYRMNDPTIPSPDYTATHNIRAHEVYWFAYDYDTIKIEFMHSDYVWQEIRVLIWAILD